MPDTPRYSTFPLRTRGTWGDQVHSYVPVQTCSSRRAADPDGEKMNYWLPYLRTILLSSIPVKGSTPPPNHKGPWRRGPVHRAKPRGGWSWWITSMNLARGQPLFAPLRRRPEGCRRRPPPSATDVGGPRCRATTSSPAVASTRSSNYRNSGGGSGLRVSRRPARSSAGADALRGRDQHIFWGLLGPRLEDRVTAAPCAPGAPPRPAVTRPP